MRVLLAGGGTAGHTSPLLATADALRRLDPDAEITCLGTPARPREQRGPRGRLPARADPAGADAREGPTPTCFKVPIRLRGAVNATLAVLDRIRPDVVVGLRRLRLDPAVPRRPPPQAPARDPRAERRYPAWRTRLGARFARRVAVSFPDTTLP